MSAPAEFATRILFLAAYAHMEHFKTDSFADHKALESLYEELPGAIDDYVEHYQGKNGKITSYPAWTPMVRPMEQMAKDMLSWIDENRKLLSGGDISLDNDIAEVRSILYRALYRLKELS
jgi:hypothetical protein